MNNKKFWCGLALGILGSKFCMNSRKNLRKLTVKTISTALCIKEDLKNTTNDIFIESKEKYDKSHKK